MIRSVEIKGLRGIREGKLDELTPLVVLVGPNGSGKSTVLDALLVGASPDPSDGAGRAVRRRRGMREGGRWLTIGTASIIIGTSDGTVRTTEVSLLPDRDDGSFRLKLDISDSDWGSEPFSTFVDLNPGGYHASGLGRPLDGVTDLHLVEGQPSELQTPLHRLYTRGMELRGPRE